MNEVKMAVAALCAAFAGTVSAFDWESVGANLDVPADTVLVVSTEADCARLAALESITVPAGSELSVRNVFGEWDTAKCDIKARLRGAGTVSFRNAGGMVLSGDNSEFAGAFWSSNSCITVRHPKALGTDNAVTHYMGATYYSRGALRFAAAGNYSNAFHFVQTSAGARAVANIGAGAVFLSGSVRVTGQVWFRKIDICCNVVQDGASGTDRGAFADASSIRADKFPALTLDYGDGVIQARGNNNTWWYGGNFICGRFVVCGGQVYFFNADSASFSANASLQFGSDLKNEDGQTTVADLTKGKLYFDGTRTAQVSFSNLLYRAEVTAETADEMDNSIDGAHIIRVTGCGPDFGWRGRLLGNISLLYDSQTESPGRLLLTHPASTTAGSLSVRRGTLIVGETATFSNVTSVSALGEGVLEIRNPSAFREGAVTLVLEGPDAGAIRVPSGVSVSFKEVLVGGRKVLPGNYFGGEGGSGAFTVLGDGKVVVETGATVTDYYWGGYAGDGDIRNKDNWYECKYEERPAPKFDGTERLFFDKGYCSDRVGTVRVTGDVRLCALAVRSLVDVTFAKGDASGRLVFCPNGPVFGEKEIEVPNAGVRLLAVDADVTVDFAVPVAFAPGLDRAVVAGRGLTLRFSDSLSGGDAAHPVRFDHFNWNLPALEFAGDGSGLASPLEIANARSVIVSSPTGLGGAGRATRISRWGTNTVRFAGAGLTNETPIRVKASDNYSYADDTMLLPTNAVERLVLRGALHIEGGRRAFEFDKTDFMGGVVAEPSATSGSEAVRLYVKGTSGTDMSGSAFAFPGADLYLRSDNDVSAHFGKAGSVWRALHLEKVGIVCRAENVLCATTPCVVGTNGWFGARIDMGGFSQALQSLRQSPDIAVHDLTPNDRAIVITSDEPAVLSLLPTSAVPETIARFTGQAGLRMKGSADSSWTLVNVFSTTTGDLTVDSGTLTFRRGAGWGGRNVTVSGGTLRISEGSGLETFGREEKADLHLSGEGTLEIDDGIVTAVGALVVDGVPLMRGRWGGPGCSRVSEDRRLKSLAGRGVLRVTKGERSGFMATIR